jgi:hypothetical protein
VPEFQDVLGHRSHRGPVVDADVRRPGDVLGLIDDDQRQGPLLHDR